MNNRMIYMSLLGSSSSLGLNWIYDKDLMSEFSKENKVLFLPIQHKLYRKAKHGFNVYPNHIVGDLDFMGEVIYLFHKYLEKQQESNFKQYMYKHIGPESSYNGYIETYGKELIETISQGNLHTDLIDKQLIGPAMYVVGYAHGLDDIETLHFSKSLTAYEETKNFHKSLRHIFINLNDNNKSDVLKESISYLSSDYKIRLKHVFTDINIDDFIKEYSGVACGLEQSFPLIYYIVHHTSNFKEALTLNSSLGGASSARGIIIGAIYSLLEEIPKEYQNMLNYKI